MGMGLSARDGGCEILGEEDVGDIHNVGGRACVGKRAVLMLRWAIWGVVGAPKRAEG